MTTSIKAGTGGPGEVPVAPLREVFLRMEPGSRTSSHPGRYPKDAANLIAERLGWYDHNGRLDGPRVRRALGLRLYPVGHGYPPATRRHVTRDMAVRMCRAMDLDPVDFGL